MSSILGPLSIGMVVMLACLLVSKVSIAEKKSQIAALEERHRKLVELTAVHFTINNYIRPALAYVKTGHQPTDHSLREFRNPSDAFSYMHMLAGRTGNSALKALVWLMLVECNEKQVSSVEWFELQIDRLEWAARSAVSAVAAEHRQYPSQWQALFDSGYTKATNDLKRAVEISSQERGFDSLILSSFAAS